MKQEKTSIEELKLDRIKEIIRQSDYLVAKPHFDGGIGFIAKASAALFSQVMVNQPLLIEGARFLLLRKGWAELTVNLEDIRVEAPAALFVSDGSIVQGRQADADADMSGIVVDEEEMSMMFGGNVPPLFATGQNHFVATVSTDIFDAVNLLLACYYKLCLLDEFGKNTKRAMATVIARIFFDIHDKEMARRQGQTTRRAETFSRFLRLVNEHCHEHRDISFYADRLCLTPRYLGTLIQQESGVMAKQWIDRAVATKAKVLLRHTTDQVSAISDALNFANVSFFCKYFKRLTGTTPQDYRNAVTA